MGYPEERTLIVGGAYSADTVSADQAAAGARGVLITLYIPALGAPNTADTLQLVIQGKEFTQIAKYYTVLSGAISTGSGTQSETILQYMVFPGSTAAAGAKANAPLPQTWRVLATISGGSWTFAVACSMIY